MTVRATLDLVSDSLEYPKDDNHSELVCLVDGTNRRMRLMIESLWGDQMHRGGLARIKPSVSLEGI